MRFYRGGFLSVSFFVTDTENDFYTEKNTQNLFYRM